MRIKEYHHWVYITPRRRVDSFNYEYFTTKLDTLTQMGKKFLILDLKNVIFLSLPTVRFLVKTAQRLHKNKGELVIVHSPDELNKNISSIDSKDFIKIIQNIEELNP